MKASQAAAIVMVMFGLTMTSANASDIAAGKEKSAICAACHGVDGNSINPVWPSLAGQHANYLYKQLQDFKEGRRNNPSMSPMASLLNDQDMKNVAAYYESQQANAVKFDADLIEKGQSIYRGGITETKVAACMGCHGPSAQGNGPAAWPLLKGQHPEYIIAQLRSFKEGLRANDPGNMMRNVVGRMSEAEMKSVAAYIAGIQ